MIKKQIIMLSKSLVVNLVQGLLFFSDRRGKNRPCAGPTTINKPPEQEEIFLSY